MSYATIEAAAVTVIRKHADFDSDNCKAGDFSMIKKGITRTCSVVYGGIRREPLTLKTERHTWTINLDLFVQYKGRAPELDTRLTSERQKVIDILGQYPRLDGCAGVTRATILNGDRPEPLLPKKGGYRGQRLYLEVRETVKPSRQE